VQEQGTDLPGLQGGKAQEPRGSASQNILGRAAGQTRKQIEKRREQVSQWSCR